ncbi:hypothetical protein YC2023_001574 [Brassica napus]
MYRGFSTITSLAQNIYNCKYLLLKAKLIKAFPKRHENKPEDSETKTKKLISYESSSDLTNRDWLSTRAGHHELPRERRPQTLKQRLLQLPTTQTKTDSDEESKQETKLKTLDN